MRIDRCVCFSRSFAELKEVAQTSGASSYAQLQLAARGCGKEFGAKCQLCRPYVKAMLKTGTTVFGEILADIPDEPEAAETTKKAAV